MFSTYKYSTGIFIKDEVEEKDLVIAKRKIRCKNKLTSNKTFSIYSNNKDVLKFKGVEKLDLEKIVLPFDMKENNKVKTITILYHTVNGKHKDYVCYLTTKE